MGDLGWIPGLGSSPGEGNGNLFQYSCLENPMERGAWEAVIHRVTKSRTQLKKLSTHAAIYMCVCVYVYTCTYIYIWGFPGSSTGKESTCNAEDTGLIPGEGIGYPLHYSGLESSMNCIVHGVTKSWT